MAGMSYNHSMASPPTIFVQIASYRDPECQWTVKDLFEKAEHPDQITVGICAQCDPELDKDCFVVPSPRPKQTKMIRVRPQESEGVCWARAETQKLFTDQDYVLMIDSHMRFIQNWDTELIAELRRCPSPKAFLSTYPPGYKPPNDLEKNPKPIVMRAKPFTAEGDVRFEGEVLSRTPEKPLRGAFLAAGLLFAPGKFVREVPYDRRIYFNQEEITLATRAFTHGWDVYSPTKAFIYHYYNEPKRGEVRPLHWHDNKDWAQFQILSMQRARYLLAGEQPKDPKALEEIAKYGLGKARSLAEYEAFSGIDFKNKQSTERATRSQFIEGLEEYRKPPDPPPNAGRVLKEKELLLPVELKDLSGNKRSTGDFAGAPCLICVVPHSFDTYTQDFMKKFRVKASGLGVMAVFVVPIPVAEAPDFVQRNGLPPDTLVDEEFFVGRLFGYSSRLKDTPLTIALDAGQVVRGVYDNRNADNHLGEVLRAAQMLHTVAPPAPRLETKLDVLPEGFNALCRGRHGVFLYNKNDVYVGKSLEAYGEWSEPEMALLSKFCPAGSVIVEAGSNIGTHTVPLAKAAGPEGRVYAFEPQRIVFQTLCANVALNGLGNVECFQAVVGDDNGTLLIPDSPYDKAVNFGGFRAKNHNSGMKVPKVTLDKFLDPPALTLIKADIEGMEIELLKGAKGLIKKFQPVLYLESEPGRDSTLDLTKMLLKMDYQPFWHIPDLYNPANFNRNPQNLFPETASFNIIAFPKGHDFSFDRDTLKISEITKPVKSPY